MFSYKLVKKLLFVVALFSTFFMSTGNVFASTLEYVDSGYYYERYQPDGSHYFSWALENYLMDGQIAYCIEPGKWEGVTYSQVDWAGTGLSNDIKERILLLAYYGYTYPGHDTLNYRAAAQGMMWETILGNGTIVNFSTAKNGGGTPIDLSSEKAEIEHLIATHHVRPSFNGQVIEAQVGESVTLHDDNGVLSNFDVTATGADVSIDGNDLTITPTSDSIDITLSKRMSYSQGYKLFYGDGVQNMLVPGTVDPIIAKVGVNAYYSTVEIHKVDSETRDNEPQGQATLEGAEYGIYTEDGDLVTILVTDEDGYAISEPVLSSGSYYLEEISRSLGYHLDRHRHYFEISDGENPSITVTEDVVKNYISILKQYEFVDGNTTFLNAESGITFEIYYPDGRKWGQMTTDKNGYATMDIPYGVWRFHQVNTTEGYEKINDFYITIDYNTEEEQYYNILNNALSAYLQVFKIDSETNEKIALANTTFKILNTDTNQYVSQYVGGIVYSEFKTDSTGKFITYLKLPAGHYKLVEVSSPQGYLLDKNGLNFAIDNDTHYTYTTYGPFVTIEFANTPIKGQIEIHKKGERVYIKNGTFTYRKKDLSDVEFNIYAREDIVSSDGNHIYYRKGELVDTVVTDENGYAISSLLPLGKYYVVEVKTQKGYVLDKKKHNITLNEIDNKTSVVYESYSKLNYLEKGTLEFTKTDLTDGKVIPNTKIEVYTENDKLIFEGVTDENGKVIIDNLFVGRFYIIETEASTGYRLSDEIVYFEITEDGEIVKANMTNAPITGTLEFTKTDISTSEPLPNTLIEIYNENDELVFSGRTDENGKIIIEELRYGRYYILEKEAPEGYELNPEKMWFEITEDGEIVKSEMKDEKIKVEVPDTLKTDYTDIETSSLILLGMGTIAYGITKKRKIKKQY